MQVEVTAWVELGGFGRGSGKTALGLGYDLLAGLNEPEIEAVIAHEMTHAKRVRRGYSRWLRNGVSRAANISEGLYHHRAAIRAAKKKPAAGSILFSISDAITRSAARLAAAYSRQDEFEADRGAAEICGAAALASALNKLRSLERITARLPWSERVGQLNARRGFSAWLLEAFSKAQFTAVPDGTAAFNKYATHPSLHDRLAALGFDLAASRVATSEKSALGLLDQPDAVAAKLIREVQKLAGEQEQKDSKSLRKWARKQRAAKKSGVPHLIGLAFLIIGVIAVVIALIQGLSLLTVVMLALTFGTSWFFFQLGRYRDRIALPIPDFSALIPAGTNHEKKNGAEIEKEFAAKVSTLKRKKQKQTALIQECYSELARANYFRAYCAARVALQYGKDNVQLSLATAVASAGLDLPDQACDLLAFVRHNAGVRAHSILWGFGWTCILLGDFRSAEAFLQEVLKSASGNPTILALLARCQEARGKSTLAIENARKASASQPDQIAYSKLLIRVLLNAGCILEAGAILEPLHQQNSTDPDLSLAWIRFKVMLGDYEKIDAWVSKFKMVSNDTSRLLSLGHIFESARQDEHAQSCYRDALQAGYYPEAYAGLGRLETHRGNYSGAKECFLKALNFNEAIGPGSAGPGPIFGATLAEILVLNPLTNSRGWIAKINSNIKPQTFAQKSLLVFAPTLPDAEAHLKEILQATWPQLPPVLPSEITWTEAGKEQQPDGPVHSGVQCVLNN